MALQLEMGCSRHQADDCLRMRLVPSSIWKPCGYALESSCITHLSLWHSVRGLFFFKLNPGSSLSSSSKYSYICLPPKSLIAYSWWRCPWKSLQSEKGREDSACILNQVPLLLPLHLIICAFESRVQPTWAQDAVSKHSNSVRATQHCP